MFMHALLSDMVLVTGPNEVLFFELGNRTPASIMASKTCLGVARHVACGFRDVRGN